MSAITPSTNVKLLKLPIELDNENQLTFATLTAQYNYFNSLPKLAVNDFTYQRKDGVIRFPGCIDDLVGYNYVMYQNTAFANKWFYAYIDKMTFVNPEMTDIQIRTDAFQTWQFDIQFLDSFVEREHVNDDTVGLHTIPEGLDTGDYVVADTVNANHDIKIPGDMLCAVGTSDLVGQFTDPTDSSSHPKPSNIINGCQQGLYYALFDDATDARNYVNAFVKDNKKDAIYTMFVVPKNIFLQIEHFPGGDQQTLTLKNVNFTYSSDPGFPTIQCYIPEDSDNESELTWSTSAVSILKPTEFYFNFDTYEPKNNKLLTFPYCYFTVTNNNGVAVNYHFEDFVDPDPLTSQTVRFGMEGCFSPGCAIKLYPLNYKNSLISGSYNDTTNNYMYGINGGKLPMMSWITDSYTNWLTQNAVNTTLNYFGSAVGVAGGTAQSLIGASAKKEPQEQLISGGATSAASGLLGMAKSLESFRQASLLPDQVGGDYNNGDLMFAKNKCAFSYYTMTIKPEYARVIDGFFDMYGYKINTVKSPNITGRRNWNYVKTIRGKIHGYIPKEDLNTISGMLDNGVTFWHSPSTFLDYSQTNDII